MKPPGSTCEAPNSPWGFTKPEGKLVVASRFTPDSTRKVYWVSPPELPPLVSIRITPAAASVPYSAAAAGPLMTSMDSMSSGLRSLSRLAFWPPTPGPVELSLFTRAPSM